MARAQRPADRRTHLPQLVATATGFRVFDPALVTSAAQTYESGGRLRRGSDAEGIVLVGLVALGGIGPPLLLAHSVLAAVLWALGGVLITMVLIGLGLEFWGEESRWRAAHPGVEPEIDVEVVHPAHGICALAARIAGTAAWRERIVDPDRRLATLVWSAAAAVRDHPDDATTGVDLGVAEENLRRLLDVARDLDRRRDHGDDVASHLRARHARRLSDDLLEAGRVTRDLA